MTNLDALLAQAAETLNVVKRSLDEVTVLDHNGVGDHRVKEDLIKSINMLTDRLYNLKYTEHVKNYQSREH